jgi:lipopolysaccharide transport system permease protein
MFWAAFVEALKCPLTDLKNAREILVKVRMPHESVVLAGLGGVVFNFLVRLLLVGAAFAFYRIVPGWNLLLVPLALLAILCFGLAIGLWLAPIGLLYEDVPRALDLVLGFGFLVTPIVYPVPKIWPASLIADLNPLVPLLEAARFWMEGTHYVPGPGFFLVTAVSFAALATGWLLYRVARPHLVARL